MDNRSHTHPVIKIKVGFLGRPGHLCTSHGQLISPVYGDTEFYIFSMVSLAQTLLELIFECSKLGISRFLFYLVDTFMRIWQSAVDFSLIIFSGLVSGLVMSKEKSSEKFTVDPSLNRFLLLFSESRPSLWCNRFSSKSIQRWQLKWF